MSKVSSLITALSTTIVLLLILSVTPLELYSSQPIKLAKYFLVAYSITTVYYMIAVFIEKVTPHEK